ncbi:DNA-directed DNA polymerase III epsilon subunit [Secundilactobacillus kimchicus JCM 15530]|uniref:3'-5' exonuclease DinG n=2 Tax=Secundilactobacillus kimchicus TaxID=528209 RepID=A0A0R1I1Y7_9LACO|nr:helicase C-terminal domain-containing protein [Secundilactobacillus kimchicus]KRK49319.1 DNA-directed DNA polymerase III epsilon subunit [Secundilactobacillus kimchicus JCM 15530]
MDANSVYAVVDIETTGTNVAEGNRTIQIGCVLVQNGRIINQFSSDVNPQMAIPPAIKNLTGISDAQVKKAPLFDDIAGTLYSLLTDTVFVAHNVNFDFPFLNAEFERVGYPALKIEAIDTVTLSQILLPSLSSFRLHDITQTLNINHVHPHSADDDALVTAELLIVLFKKLQTLPIVTLQRMVEIGAELPQNTAAVFEWALTGAKKQHSALPDDLMVTNSMALRRVRQLRPDHQTAASYPKTKKSKLKHYPKQFEWRADQAKMMNLIYRHYQPDQPENVPLIVEAPTGTGKTLGYMFPLAYLSQSTGRQAVIATDTVLLQNQLADQTVPLLQRMLPFEISVAVVKGNQHYIDVSRFVEALGTDSRSKQSQLIKLRLLVWLTETETGDLDELHFRNDPPFLDVVRHRGLNQLDETDAFYEVDFLRRLYQRLPDAMFVIVNHAFLVQRAQSLGRQLRQPFLVIDEAQHLADYAMRSQRQRFDFQEITNLTRHMNRRLDADNEHGLVKILTGEPYHSQLAMLATWTTEFDRQLTALSAYLINAYQEQLNGAKQQPFVEIALDNTVWQTFVASRSGLFEQLQILMDKLHAGLATLSEAFEKETDRWLVSERQSMTQLQTDFHKIEGSWSTLMTMQQQESSEQLMHWLTVSADRQHLILTASLISVKGFLTNRVYAAFKAPIFTGATLFSSNRSQYLYDELDLDRNKTKIRRMKSDFNFEQQAQLYVSTEAPEISDTPAYETYLAKALKQLMKASNRPTLVLFNSLSTVASVYERLTVEGPRINRVILAQGISGGKEKMIKRFMDEDNAVLLGAATFWEGIDLPQDKLQLLVITRLPFDAPEQLEVKARYNQLKAAGKSPFYNLALPKATLRLRQGVGRLIRTSDDYGVVVVLDSRLATHQYGQTMLKTLPTSLPVKKAGLTEIVKGTQNFFKIHRSSAQD